METAHLEVGDWLLVLLLQSESQRRFCLQHAVERRGRNDFVDWGEIFSDSVLATAILDQLLHHSTPMHIKGKGYRLKNKRNAGLLNSPKERLPASAG